jgi:CheY-like chemotaxis protein
VSGIVSACELLMLQTPTAEQLRTLELIQKAGVHLIKLLNDILDFSKMDAHGITIKNEFIDVHKVFFECVELFRPLANAKSLDLNVSVAIAPNTKLYVDPFRLKQVTTNLLANAIKFTLHGHIDLSVELLPLDASDAAPMLRLIIEDSGIGIKQSEIEKLFQPFFQVDSSQSRAFGGTGLGLTISKQLVDLMGGHIAVKSEIGLGSRFTVDLPVQVEIERVVLPVITPELVPQALTPIEPMPLAGKKVLFAEDNPIIQSVYSSLLSNLGCLCTLASNGEDAYDQFINQSFDAIVMDCHMPKLDGFEATLRIRAWEFAHPEQKQTPIIALTASFALEDQLRCKEVGVNEFCTKPLTRESLKAVLTQCLIV